MVKRKYYLWILGCAMNYSDAERIASVFETAGFRRTTKEAEADVALVVACSVRQTAIDRIYGKVKPWDKRRRKGSLKTVLAGCVLPDDKRKLAKSFDLIFEIKNIEQLEGFLSDELKSKKLNKNSKLQLSPGDRRGKITNYERDYLKIVPCYSSYFRAYVPIMTGCNNFCSYCAVPYTRGREKSRPAKDILAECQELIAKGYKELTLLGQNVNSYNPKHKTHNSKQNNNFVELLKSIDEIEGDHRVYFYSNHPKDFSDELIALLPTLKHFPAYIHLPLQSGNDKLLRQMNRHYTAERYLDLVAKIRHNIPDVILTTDIMVGYPGEGEAEFIDTVRVIKQAQFEMIFIGQYSPRVGTPSSKLIDDVSNKIKKERERIITDVLRHHLEKINKNFIGRSLSVLVDEKKGSNYYGRTEGYKVVEIKTDQVLPIGQFCTVKILGSMAWKLKATLS